MLGMSAGSTTTAPSRVEHGDGVGHHLRLVGDSGRRAARPNPVPVCGRRRTPAGCRCARRASAVRAAGSACSRAPGGGVQARVAGSFGSGAAPSSDAEQDRRVRDRFRHRTRRVLVRRDRNHAVAADAAHGRLDAHQHVLVRRAENRSGRFGADVGRPEAGRRANARARPAGGQHRPAVARRDADRAAGRTD